MSFKSDNTAFEKWLRHHCDVIERDLSFKHKRMKESPFIFLRATYFRFAKEVESLCPTLAKAPHVLAVGDSHVENFGTWRDDEGRLVWGVNDFDEASVMPYPFDLVRLAASVQLAPGLVVRKRDAAKAILKGYARGLEAPRPTLLDEQETWMRPFVACPDEEREKFWEEVAEYPPASPPRNVRKGLEKSLPGDAVKVKFRTRRKGSGGLGRPRYVAVAEWRGGQIVREAKALVPSAWDWAHDRSRTPIRFAELSRGRYRSPDPFLKVRSDYVFRRIAADSRKVELGDDAGHELKQSLLEAMGFELASIHAAADGAPKKVLRNLRLQPRGWLQKAAEKVASAVKKDYAEWAGR